jgi:NAD(P)-dependent dehydrogenase (short-subunit alcohol dehydrogenase family)
MQVEGSVALVTGASSGLGLGACEVLTAGGAKVIGLDVASKAGAASSANLQLQMRVDVSDASAVEKAVEDIVHRFGRIDIAVNCAGIGSAKKTISKGRVFPLEEWERVIAVNLTGTFNVIRFAARAMASNAPDVRTGERGVIVNVASVAATQGQVGQAAYSASKAGVVGLTLPVARDLAQYAIRVVTINPGLFDTPLASSLPHVVDAMLRRMVLYPPRAGRPEEFGRLVRHIVENEYLNATDIDLHAGISVTAES